MKNRALLLNARGKQGNGFFAVKALTLANRKARLLDIQIFLFEFDTYNFSYSCQRL